MFNFKNSKMTERFNDLKETERILLITLRRELKTKTGKYKSTKTKSKKVEKNLEYFSGQGT
jgi:hypothetical protein